MDHRIPRLGLIVSIGCVVLAVVTFVFLNLAFEGPSVLSGLTDRGYELKATFKQTEVLPTKQPVLERGLEVGKVTDVEFNQEDSTATVTFTIDEEYTPVYADATVAIGERTILGDSYLKLDRGTESAGETDSGESVKSVPSVDFDEALDFLDVDGREHLRSTLDEFAKATRANHGGARLSATLGELSHTVRELRDTTDALRGQDDEIASIIRDSSLVLDELGSRERSLRTITGSGRVTLDALATNSDSLDQGLAELPPLLGSARDVLAQSRPLFREAGPLVRELRRAAPHLTPVIAELPSISADTVDVVSGLSAVPAFGELLELVELVEPAVPGMEAIGRNLVPLLDYTADRGDGVASFFANLAGVNAHGDANGRWARFAILFEEGEVDDVPTPAECSPEDDIPSNAGFCHNAYPDPGDARNPEPYESGSYARLKPFNPKVPGR